MVANQWTKKARKLDFDSKIVRIEEQDDEGGGERERNRVEGHARIYAMALTEKKRNSIEYAWNQKKRKKQNG